MSKTNRLITLDFELNEKLKGVGNASALVNRLLESHFNAHLSNDIEFLTKKVEEIDIQTKTLEVNRDAMAERIRIISERTKNHEEEKEAKKSLDNKIRDLNKWLEQKCKDKIITFEQYRNIKHFENFEDCMEAVINGDLDILELAEKAKPKDLNSLSTSNVHEREGDE